MTRTGRESDVSGFAIHAEEPIDRVIGRVVERGLSDELKGTAYAIVEGIDGRTHHLQFGDLDLTGDAEPGAIVEARAYENPNGRRRLTLAVRSDLSVAAQINAAGATWLDRQLVSGEPALSENGFAGEVRRAMARRADHLVEQGLASRQGQRIIFARDLLSTLRRRELDATTAELAKRTGLPHKPAAEGDTVAGVYRQRLNLASGRFAMIDDGLGFQLVPWRPAMEAKLGQHVSGTMTVAGVDWDISRKRGLGI
jgi:Protein of unknown function (DUF3363)